MPAGFTTVSAAHLQDATGTPITNATISFLPVANDGTPISFQTGGTNGQTISQEVSSPVVDGAFTIQLADTSLSSPVNVGYRVTVTDNAGHILLSKGYTCIQPIGENWSLDTYTPNFAPQLTVQVGPQGPAGTDGATNPNFTAAVTFPAAVVGGSSGSELSSALSDNYAHSFEDQSGSVAVGISAIGVLLARAFAFVSGTITNLTTTNHTTLNLSVGSEGTASGLSSGPGDAYALSVEDSSGLVPFGVDSSGVTHIARAVVGPAGSSSRIVSSAADAWAHSIEDGSGYVALGIDQTGVTHFAVAKAGTLTVTNLIAQSLNLPPVIPPAALAATKGLSFPYEWVYFASYGQSLSFGTWSIPALSTTQAWDSLMFNGGIIAQANNGGSSAESSLVTLIEQQLGTYNSSTNAYTGLANATISSLPTGETPISGAFEQIKGLLVSENGIEPSQQPFVFIGSCPGQGGTPLAGLSRGTVPYNRLLNEVQQVATLASAAGKIFGVPALAFTQGENNINTSSSGTPSQLASDASTYASALTTFFANLNTDIKAITGQVADAQFIIYQTFAHDYGAGAFSISIAQLQVAESVANVHIGTPCYPLQTDQISDNTHLCNYASKMLGGYYGKAFKRLIVDGESAYRPLTPNSVRFSGSSILVQVQLDTGSPQTTPITIDTANYTTMNGAQPNAGFALTDSAGNAIAITSVQIVGEDRIKINASQAVVPTNVLTYGAGARGGNIRDSAGAYYTVNAGGTIHPLHNWLRQFTHTF